MKPLLFIFSVALFGSLVLASYHYFNDKDEYMDEPQDQAVVEQSDESSMSEESAPRMNETEREPWELIPADDEVLQDEPTDSEPAIIEVAPPTAEDAFPEEVADAEVSVESESEVTPGT